MFFFCFVLFCFHFIIRYCKTSEMKQKSCPISLASKPRTRCILGMCSTTELRDQAILILLQEVDFEEISPLV